jgi:MarR family transcriptional regulator, organic hydroperoxide resistance regulator
VPVPRKGPQLIGETLQFMQGLWELTHALQVSSRRMLRVLGVPGPQRLVIRVIGQTPDIAPRDLAEVLGLHPSTLTGVLARLERDKLVERVPDPQDRRRLRLRLTAGGRRIDRQRRGTIEAAVRRALVRADAATIATTGTMIALLVEELDREF